MWRQARQADRNMENDMNRLMAALPPPERGRGDDLLLRDLRSDLPHAAGHPWPSTLVPVFLLLVTMVPVQARDDAETERIDAGAAGTAAQLSAQLRCGGPLQRYPVCGAGLRRAGAERRPAGAHQAGPSTARPATSGICSTTTPTPPNRGRKPPRRRRSHPRKKA